MVRKLLPILALTVAFAGCLGGSPCRHCEAAQPLNLSAADDAGRFLRNVNALSLDRIPAEYRGQMEWHKDFARSILALDSKRSADNDRLREQLADLQWMLALAVPCEAQANVDPVNASVRVDCPQGGGVTYSGSGTVVAVEDGRALVLTNRHVAEHAGPIVCRLPDGTTHGAVWLGTDPTADLAALMITATEKVTACPPAEKPAPTGTVLVQVGYPRTFGPIRRVGQFLGFNGWLMTGARVTHAAIATDQGDSGSGCFHNGELVAVVWGGANGECAAVDLADVHRFSSTGPVAKRFPLLAARSRRCDCGQAGPCGGRCGDNCNCVAHWAPAEDCTADLGFYDATDTFKGRYVAKDKAYYPYDGKSFGRPVKMAKAPHAGPLVAPKPKPAYSPPPFMGGGCPGGNCRGR